MTSSLSTAIRPPRVSIIGAGKVGSALAQRIAERNLADVVLLDVVEGLPQGIALDLMEARALEGHSRVIFGTNDYQDTAGSDVVVIAAGLPRKPGMSRDDLVKTNARIVREATKEVVTYSPDAILIPITNPLDVMTYLAWEVSGSSPRHVVGMAGVLDAARFQTFIALELGVSPADVRAMVLGAHGDSMVPLPRYSTVRGIPLTELLDASTIAGIVQRTRHGGAEIVELLKSGGAYWAPASAACTMIEAILGNESRILPCCAYLQGEYGLEDIFIGVPCCLAGRGVEAVLELSLTEAERRDFLSSVASVRDNLAQVKAMKAG